MREFSVPPAATIADSATLTDAVWDNAELAPDAIQFRARRAGGWADITCVQFRDEVAALARGLIAAGVAPGMRVGLMSRTRYEWSLIDYAIWSCGAVTVPLYETSSAEQVEWILADSGAVACFVENDRHAAVVGEVRDRLPDLANVWCIEDGAIGELYAAGAPVDEAEVDRRRHLHGAGDVATIIYTSGTTGRPKGCVLTHRNILSDAGAAIAVLPQMLKPGASTLLFLPLAHSFARLIQVGLVIRRVTTGFAADTRTLMEDLQTLRPTFVLAVPRVFEKVYTGARQKATATHRMVIFGAAERTAIAYSRALDTPGGPDRALRLRHAVFDRLVYGKIRAALGGRCTAAISGGAPLGERLGHFFRGFGIAIHEGYGMTETSPAIAVDPEDAPRIGTVGRPLPGVTVRIADDEELLVKGDIVFAGYLNNPEATAETLDEQGWLHTGDLAALDDDGYIKIIGRKKEIIVTAGGKNVAPSVLEDRLRAHPLVSQCMVVGDAKPFIGALITIDPEVWPVWLAEHGHPADATVDQLRDDPQLRREIQRAVDDANKAVSRAEAIKVFRILATDFTESSGELTPSLKVRRGVVMKKFDQDITAIYAK